MKPLNLWPTTITTTHIHIYDDKLRKLLRLPVRKGEIKEVLWQGGRLSIKFEKTNCKKLVLK
jgi:hypothetical protein